MIYFYYGDNDFGIKQQTSLVKSQFAKKYGSENIVTFNSSETEQVLAEVVNVGLFSSNRLVILDDVFSNIDLVKKLPEIIPLIDSNTELIIISAKPDKRTKLYKILSSKNSREFKQPVNIRRFVNEEAGKQKIKINNEAIDELVLYTSGDIWKISNEITKMRMLKKNITKNDIEKIVEPNLEVDVFQVLDSILNKQFKKVENRLDILKKNEDPNRFLAFLISQVFALSVAKNSNKPSSVSAKEAKIHPYVMSKMYNTAKKTTKEEIAKTTKIIASTDAKLKLSNKEDGWYLIGLAIKRIIKTS